MLKSAEDLVVSVADHNGAKGQTHDEQSERLQTIEVAQTIPPKETMRLSQLYQSRQRSGMYGLRGQLTDKQTQEFAARCNTSVPSVVLRLPVTR
jgi:hypothetical protein